MVQYRIDTLATGSQRPVCYIFGVSTLTPAADITAFYGSGGQVLAVCPVNSNTAYVQEGTAQQYRIDTTPTGVQRACVYLFGVSLVVPGAGVTVFYAGTQVIAICPVSSNIAYVQV